MTPRKTKNPTRHRVAAIKPELLSTPGTKASDAVALKLVAPAAKEVAIAGSFNDWKPAPLARKSIRGDEWGSELTLAPGRYEYLFVVDGQWLPDPAAEQFVPNPFGGMNSVLSVG